jgi:hypothetical protein
LLDEELPEIIINSIIYDKEFQKSFISNEKIDEIIKNCLDRKFNNQETGQAFWSVLDRQMIAPIIYDLNISIDIEKTDDNYIFHKKSSYSTVLNKASFTFLFCKYEEGGILNYINDCDSIHSFSDGFDSKGSAIENSFEIKTIKINSSDLDKEEEIVKEGMKIIKFTGQNLNMLLSNIVKIEYEYTTIINNELPYYIHHFIYPCKGFSIKFDVSKAGWGNLRMIRSLVSEEKIPILDKDNESNKSYSVTTSTKWVFPCGHIVFVWEEK